MKKIIFLFLFLGFQLSLIANDASYKQFKSGQDAINWWLRLYGNNILNQEEKKYSLSVHLWRFCNHKQQVKKWRGIIFFR